MSGFYRVFVFSGVLSLFILTGCGPSAELQGTQTADAATDAAAHWTATPTKTKTAVPSLLPSETPPPSTWDRYAPRTMAEIIASLDDKQDLETLENSNIYLEMSPDYQVPSVVQMTYTGDFRDVSETRATIIPIWLGTFAPQLNAEGREQIFATEALFIQNDVEYWIPVQGQLIPYLEDELQPGDEVVLWLIWIGASMMDDQMDLVFLVNEFCASPECFDYMLP
jgi:hypothetical protein